MSSRKLKDSMTDQELANAATSLVWSAITDCDVVHPVERAAPKRRKKSVSVDDDFVTVTYRNGSGAWVYTVNRQTGHVTWS